MAGSEWKAYPPAPPPSDQPPSSGQPQGGCFIATAAMGSSMHPHVQSLRDFRDNVLLQSRYAETFQSLLQTYYRFSPPIANAMNRNNKLRLFLRYTLVYPIVFALRLIVPVTDKILGIGRD